VHRFQLTVENEPAVSGASWEQVASALNRIESGRRAFVILEANDENYVQALGAPNELTVEWRARSGDVMSHQVLGRRGWNSAEVQNLPGSSGCKLTVLKHEVLDLTDALILFRSFYEHLKVPDAYRLREITRCNVALALWEFEPFALALLWEEWRTADTAAAQVLECHLDRVDPRWRDGAASEVTMTRDEAFAIIGIFQSATADDMRKRYRDLMLRYKPDRGGSSVFAAKINEAMTILERTAPWNQERGSLGRH
jgi:hypothetical protein